jgi:hypothetical protein
MQKRRSEYAVRFKIWTAQGTWFWSLVYRDRHGGAIGAAPSQAVAVVEARAAIEGLHELPQRDFGKLRGRDASRFTRGFHSSKDSRIRNALKVDCATGDCECSERLWHRSSGMRAIAGKYNHLWRMTLQHYAARLAEA